MRISFIENGAASSTEGPVDQCISTVKRVIRRTGSVRVCNVQYGESELQRLAELGGDPMVEKLLQAAPGNAVTVSEQLGGPPLSAGYNEPNFAPLEVPRMFQESSGPQSYVGANGSTHNAKDEETAYDNGVPVLGNPPLFNSMSERGIEAWDDEFTQQVEAAKPGASTLPGKAQPLPTYNIQDEKTEYDDNGNPLLPSPVMNWEDTDEDEEDYSTGMAPLVPPAMNWGKED